MSKEISSYNLATGNKWLLVIPFQKIEPTFKEKNVSFNLTNFSIPELVIGSTDINILAQRIPIPNKVREDAKTITFNYMLSSDWHQYKILYKWFNLIVNEQGSSSTINDSDFLLDLTVFFLSEFKNPIFQFIFRGCWISSIEGLDLNYQDVASNINHSFTISYAFFEIENLLEGDPPISL